MTGTNAMELGMGLEPTTCALRMRYANAYKRLCYQAFSAFLTLI